VTPAGLQYLVMDFLKGETLSSLLRRRGRLVPHHALTLLDGMLAGLDAAHRAQVVHRDLKPSNVFLSPLADGSVHVRLLDFGIARPLAGPRRTNAGVVLGTPGFMAPEQLVGDALTERTDLYALGVMAFAMLTGQSPFPINDLRELSLAHIELPAPRLSDKVKGIPPQLDAMVARLLEKLPANRPASAAEVRNEFKRIRLAIAQAPTDPMNEVGPLGNLVKTRPFPLNAGGAGGVGNATTRSGRVVRPTDGPATRPLGWKAWAGAAVLVVVGFGLGIWGMRSAALTPEAVRAQLAAARTEAETLDPTQNRAMRAELDALETRLKSGESPGDVANALGSIRTSHKLGTKP
jgi:serine/threonine-protein kinase